MIATYTMKYEEDSLIDSKRLIIPPKELEISVSSESVVVATRKLNAKWTIETDENIEGFYFNGK